MAHNITKCYITRSAEWSGNIQWLRGVENGNTWFIWTSDSKFMIGMSIEQGIKVLKRLNKAEHNDGIEYRLIKVK